MKIYLKNTNLILKYEDKEIAKLKEVFEYLRLEEAETKNLFGTCQSAKFYREREQELKYYLLNTLRQKLNFDVDDNINNPPFRHHTLNLAIFRVVPSLEGEVCIKLDKFLTIADLREILCNIKSVLEVLLNIVFEHETEIKCVVR